MTTREEQIIKASQLYAKALQKPFMDGAMWADANPNLYSVTRKAVERALKNLWYDAQGDVLPEIDREVIVLCGDGHGGYKVCFGHRPYKKGYLGKSLVTGNIEAFYPQVYDKGEWNIPDVKWWLDLDLPNLEE